jgi:hypothetical protein
MRRLMDAKVGDTILVESNKVGVATREGEVVAVIGADYGKRYQVRWADGHETTVHPTPGTMRVLAGSRKRSR